MSYDAAGMPLDDPRPVYQGDPADKVALGAHGAAVRAWKKRQRQVSPYGMDPDAEQRVSGLDALAVLEAVISDPKTLQSDRIRAVTEHQRILHRQEEERLSEEHGDLQALHALLLTLPLEERVVTLEHVLSRGMGVQTLQPVRHAASDDVQGGTVEWAGEGAEGAEGAASVQGDEAEAPHPLARAVGVPALPGASRDEHVPSLGNVTEGQES